MLIDRHLHTLYALVMLLSHGHMGAGIGCFLSCLSREKQAKSK